MRLPRPSEAAAAWVEGLARRYGKCGIEETFKKFSDPSTPQFIPWDLSETSLAAAAAAAAVERVRKKLLLASLYVLPEKVVWRSFPCDAALRASSEGRDRMSRFVWLSTEEGLGRNGTGQRPFEPAAKSTRGHSLTRARKRSSCLSRDRCLSDYTHMGGPLPMAPFRLAVRLRPSRLKRVVVYGAPPESAPMFEVCHLESQSEKFFLPVIR